MDETTTKFVAIELPDHYPGVLLMAGLLAMECLIVGMVFPGMARGHVYRDS